MRADGAKYHVLGVRAEPAAFHWAVVSGTSHTPVLEDSNTEAAPAAFTEGESLAWIRDRFLQIVENYHPMKVAVRFPEGNARGSGKDSAKARCRVEGVVMETASSRNIEVITGALNTFKKHSGSKSPKEDLAKQDLRGLDWSKYSDTKRREAILVAASVLPVRLEP